MRRQCFNGSPCGNTLLAVCWRKLAPGPASQIVSVPDNNGDSDSGAAAALRRLELTELQSFRELQLAIKENNPIRVRQCHDIWLKCGEALRKYDLLVEATRRDAGALVPIDEVRSFVETFILFTAIALTFHAESLANELDGKDARTIYAAIRNCFDATLVSTVFGYVKATKAPEYLTKFAEEVMRARMAHYKSSGLFEHTDKAVDALVQWVKQQ